ncbi:MAG: metallophosphatase family protein [Gemmataceae bacterium]|nr:metallophosphatase family protein [Gemmataceae bacterium]
MRIAIISDTHSRTATMRLVLDRIAEMDVGLIIHCGDMEDAHVVELFPPHTHFVFGNCDEDRGGIAGEAKRIGATHHGIWGQLEIDGVHIAWTHGDDRRTLRELEASQAFDFLFYGHTHVAEQHQSGKTRIVNPGALHRARPKQFVVLDTATRELESIVLEESA